MLLERFNPRRVIPRTRRIVPRNITTGNNVSLAGNVFESIRNMLHLSEEDFSTQQCIPSIDISEKENEVVLRAELPGMEANDVEISLEEGCLVIKGEKKAEDENSTYHQRERFYGSFYRSIPVSRDISEEDIKASFKDSVLTIQLSRANHESP